MNLSKYVKNYYRWEAVIVTKNKEIHLESRNLFEVYQDLLWGFRFKEAQYAYIKSINKKGCVASYNNEKEVMGYFTEHWPNVNDFVWAHRH